MEEYYILVESDTEAGTFTATGEVINTSADDARLRCIELSQDGKRYGVWVYESVVPSQVLPIPSAPPDELPSGSGITINTVADLTGTGPVAATGTVDPPDVLIETTCVSAAGVEGSYAQGATTGASWTANVSIGTNTGPNLKLRVRQVDNHANVADSNPFTVTVPAQLYIVTNPTSPQTAGPVTLGGNILPNTLADKSVEAAPLIGGVEGTYVPMVTTGTTWTGSVTMAVGIGSQIRARVVSQPGVFKDSTPFDVE